jgi:hypothetical protein
LDGSGGGGFLFLISSLTATLLSSGRVAELIGGRSRSRRGGWLRTVAVGIGIVVDLEKKIKANPDCKHCMISHMRGKVADMNRVKELCDENDVILLEDCAHSLGVFWEGEHTRHKGIACGISSQSYKMINSGEGGFLLPTTPTLPPGLPLLPVPTNL